MQLKQQTERFALLQKVKRVNVRKGKASKYRLDKKNDRRYFYFIKKKHEMQERDSAVEEAVAAGRWVSRLSRNRGGCTAFCRVLDDEYILDNSNEEINTYY